jgi:hypothetical protein
MDRYATRTDRNRYTRCVCGGPCQYADADAVVVPEGGSALTVTYCAGINRASTDPADTP